MAGAEAEAKKNSWPVVIVILDSGGQLVMLQRLDNAQWGSVDIAKEKARSAVALRRPTKAFQDLIAQGGANLRLLNIGFSVLEGGIPIVVDGKIIGSVGVSGVTSQQDAQIAQAGIDAHEVGRQRSAPVIRGAPCPVEVVRRPAGLGPASALWLRGPAVVANKARAPTDPDRRRSGRRPRFGQDGTTGWDRGDLPR